MHCAMGLIALGVGYLVLLQANKEKEGLKLLGQVIAVLIMIGALVSGICAAKCKFLGEKAPMCPMSAKMMDMKAEQ